MEPYFIAACKEWCGALVLTVFSSSFVQHGLLVDCDIDGDNGDL